MAYDETLARRIRRSIGDRDGIVEKKMFGGLGFLLHGNMSCGIHGDELIVRIDPSATEGALAEPGTRVFDITGRPMKGWLLVGGTVLLQDDVLADWVQRSLDFAASLPPK
jgi:TfoX/Sxy family transcriptional regulator of competence genes